MSRGDFLFYFILLLAYICSNVILILNRIGQLKRLIEKQLSESKAATGGGQ